MLIIACLIVEPSELYKSHEDSIGDDLWSPLTQDRIVKWTPYNLAVRKEMDSIFLNREYILNNIITFTIDRTIMK
jgi:hypothetical protein